MIIFHHKLNQNSLIVLFARLIRSVNDFLLLLVDGVTRCLIFFIRSECVEDHCFAYKKCFFITFFFFFLLMVLLACISCNNFNS